MTDLLWPGDDRAGTHLTDASLLEHLVAVEAAWLDALVAAGVAPADAKADLTGLVGPADLSHLTAAAEAAGGNPVIPLVALLRDRLGKGAAASWLHRGLTSQDVLDTALVLAARDAVGELLEHLRGLAGTLAALAAEHRDAPMAGRTLTQHAVPVTFGLKAARWLEGVLDAHDDLTALHLPAQVGGAAGTLAAAVELAGSTEVSLRLAADLADRLGLEAAPPWHTVRTPVTRLGDAATRCTDACGRIAADVLTLGRPEIGELAEGSPGGSSTMPHKANPTLATLVRRAALTVPQLAATLHLAAADSGDERPAGAWHAEWGTLRTLLRRTLVAASQSADLLAGLQVHVEAMRATVEAADGDLRAEQRTMADLAGHAPRGDYLGVAGELVDAVLDRARRTLQEDTP